MPSAWRRQKLPRKRLSAFRKREKISWRLEFYGEDKNKKIDIYNLFYLHHDDRLDQKHSERSCLDSCG